MEEKPPKRKDKIAPPALSDQQIEALLDHVENAVLSRDAEKLESLSEELWQARKQAPEVVVDRLVSGRARVPAAELDILSSLAGNRGPTYLRRVAQDPRAADIVRFGAQRRAGWPKRAETKKRLAFLKTLKDPDGTLAVAVGQACAAWPPDLAVLAEVLGYLSCLPRQSRISLIERVAKEQGRSATWLLHAALQIPDPESQRTVLRELARLRDPGSVRAIERFRQIIQDAGLRDEAGLAIERLRQRAPAKRKAPVPLPPLGQALMTAMDAVGAQLTMVSRNLDEENVMFAHFLCTDVDGVKEIVGSRVAEEEFLDDMLNHFADIGIEWVQVDLPAVRGVLKSALEVNAACGRALPLEFELWEPLVHDEYPASDDEQITVVELDDSGYRGRKNLIRSSKSLLDHPLFQTWTFNPDLISQLMRETPAPKAARLIEDQYAPMIGRLFGARECEQFRSRLRRQAWLLDWVGDEKERDQALAVAAQLADGPSPAISKIPFLRAMITRSVTEVLFDRQFMPIALKRLLKLTGHHFPEEEHL